MSEESICCLDPRAAWKGTALAAGPSAITRWPVLYMVLNA